MYGDNAPLSPREASALRGFIALAVAAAIFFTVGYWTGMRRGAVERDALRATVTALREGDGSCAVTREGPRLVCWWEGGVKVMPLKPGDVIVSRDCLAKRSRKTCAR